MARLNDIIVRLRGLRNGAQAFAVRHRLGWRHGAATGAILLAGVAVTGLARAVSGQGHATIDPTERLKIEVVQPVEPVLTAGPIMEVGTLVDGFDPGMIRFDSPTGPDPYVAEPYVEEDRSGPSGFFRRFSSAIEQAMPRREERPPPPRIRREDRSYGFNEPRPDWEAEREARRAWRDRVEAERRAEREMRDRYEDERQARRDARDPYEDDRRDRREMRQRMDEPPPYDPYDEEPVG